MLNSPWHSHSCQGHSLHSLTNSTMQEFMTSEEIQILVYVELEFSLMSKDRTIEHKDIVKEIDVKGDS